MWVCESAENASAILHVIIMLNEFISAIESSKLVPIEVESQSQTPSL